MSIMLVLYLRTNTPYYLSAWVLCAHLSGAPYGLYLYFPPTPRPLALKAMFFINLLFLSNQLLCPPHTHLWHTKTKAAGLLSRANVPLMHIQKAVQYIYFSRVCLLMYSKLQYATVFGSFLDYNVPIEFPPCFGSKYIH